MKKEEFYKEVILEYVVPLEKGWAGANRGIYGTPTGTDST